MILVYNWNREFPSKNKLFQYIKETGHALRTTNNTLPSSAVIPTDYGKKNKKETNSIAIYTTENLNLEL